MTKEKTQSVGMQGPVCPVPLSYTDKILMGHGSGGRMMYDLIRKTFHPAFKNEILASGDDAGVVPVMDHTRLAVSTDAHVVSPLFFPGGDIGRLAVCGTVNDVAVMGAVPKYITAGFILEEGLEISVLHRVINSMQAAAKESGVQIIAGDTKVVQKGKGDGMYITTCGIGEIEPGVDIRGSNARPGNVIILSGTIGDHGIAVLDARGDLGFHSDIHSDVAPLNHLIAAMMATSKSISVLRDPTRGGVASTLNEIAHQSGVNMLLDENSIPVRPDVAAACEMLGFDPLYIANEGKLIAIVAENDISDILHVMRNTKYGENSVVIGKVEETKKTKGIDAYSIRQYKDHRYSVR